MGLCDFDVKPISPVQDPRHRKSPDSGLPLIDNCPIMQTTKASTALSIGQIVKTRATAALPRAARRALVKLGEDIAVARKKRRISTVSMAERAFISRGTLHKVEQGDPSVSMGIYASVLGILGLADGLENVADRSSDALGLDIEEDRLPKKIQPRRRSRWPT